MLRQVKRYNDDDMRAYRQRVEEWQKDQFTHNIIPQIAFVGFRLPNGEMRQRGWVVSNGNNHRLFKNKQEALANS
jgi:hypothetical protein